MRNVEVYQEGTSQRHTARCECGWQSSTGHMKAAQDLAKEHRRDGCVAPQPSTELVPATTSAVAEPAGRWDDGQVELLRQQICPGATDEELAFFAQVCEHKQLDPFLGEIVGIMRYDSKAHRDVMKIQETVEGLRTIAERSGTYGGYRGPQWTADGATWVDAWLSDDPPAAARIFVFRKDWMEPASGVARWASNAQFKKDGELTPIWKDRPDEMLAKCAEVRALKRAFPKEFARAGVPVRDLTDAQVVTIEARRAGLDDDGRHALVAQVTAGRTQSTRDLTDTETLEVRTALAQQRPAPAPPEEYGGGVTETPPDAVARAIARGGGDLEARLEALTAAQLVEVKEFRRAKGLTRPVATMNVEQRRLISNELTRRGWGPSPYDMEDPPDADRDDNVVDGDVIEPDLFDEEPF